MSNAGKREMGPKCGSLPRNAGELAGLNFWGNILILINFYSLIFILTRDLYYVVALYTNGHDRIGRFCSYQLNRASSLWTFLYVVTIINEHAHNFWGNNVPPMFPQCSPNVPPMFPQCSPNVPPMFPQCSPNVPPVATPLIRQLAFIQI